MTHLSSISSLSTVAHAQYRSCSWQDSNNTEVTDNSYFFDIFNMSLSFKLSADWLMFKLLERDGWKDINTTNRTIAPEKESELACSTECYVYITVEMSQHSCTHFERKKGIMLLRSGTVKQRKLCNFVLSSNYLLPGHIKQVVNNGYDWLRISV